MISYACDVCKEDIGSSERVLEMRTTQLQFGRKSRIVTRHLCSVTCAKNALKNALSSATLPEDSGKV